MSRVMLMMLLILTLLPMLIPAQQGCPKRQIVTFNTGLTPLVDNYVTRRTLMPRALRTVPADVMCLQEVWFESDMKNIVSSLSDMFPYSWSPLHFSTLSLTMPKTGVWGILTEYLKSFRSAPCSDINSVPFLRCVLYRCSSSRSSLFQCVYVNCFMQIFDLSEPCRTCLLVGAEKDISSTLSRCLTLSRTDNRLNTEGLLILSKYPLSSVRRHRFLPGVKQLLPRGYLQVEIPSVGTVLCAHLTSNIMSRMQFTDQYPEFQIQASTGISSYKEQQRAEIDTIIYNHQTPHILVGDLNTGPVIPSKQIDGEFASNYEVLTKNSYRNIYLMKGDSKCTLCADNPIAHKNVSVIIDHVLVKGKSAVSARRILVNRVNGEIMSDHYGMQVAVCAST